MRICRSKIFLPMPHQIGGMGFLEKRSVEI